MVCRGGGVWISENGISPYQQVTDRSVYPDVNGEFEDPVIWKDSLQYHLIVNDWLGRIAYYQRSIDGIHWITEEGEAYTPGIAAHKDGYKENWFKYERMKCFRMIRTPHSGQLCRYRYHQMGRPSQRPAQFKEYMHPSEQRIALVCPERRYDYRSDQGNQGTGESRGRG